LNHEILKAQHRAQRDRFPPALDLRIHRALSWLQRAEQEADDPDAQFIFLWIAFNAAYANEDGQQETTTERGRFKEFLAKLVGLDGAGRLYDLTWKTFPGPIRALMDNEFVFAPFWEFQRGERTDAEWRERFVAAKKAAHRALAEKETATVLSIVFDRLYVLRNQLMHGGATWNGNVNRQQVKDGARLLGAVVPVLLSVMMEGHDKTLWGAPAYPVVDG